MDIVANPFSTGRVIPSLVQIRFFFNNFIFCIVFEEEIKSNNIVNLGTESFIEPIVIVE